MSAKCCKFVLVFVVALAGVCPAGGQAVRFSREPTVKVAAGKVTVSFAVSGPTDVEVAVLDSAGKVVRHLAAGRLGDKKAPPEPLKPGLRQEIVWDGKDDAGKDVPGGPAGCKVRVRAGMTARLGLTIGQPERIWNQIYGLATDEKGRLYVATGGVYSSRPVLAIKVFDRTGKYLRTILPPPAGSSRSGWTPSPIPFSSTTAGAA